MVTVNQEICLINNVSAIHFVRPSDAIVQALKQLDRRAPGVSGGKQAEAMRGTGNAEVFIFSF